MLNSLREMLWIKLLRVINLAPLIDESTNIRTIEMSCIGLIITDQPNLFVEFGAQSSPDDHYQHQIIHGKLNISVPLPTPYKRKVWYYAKAQKDRIKSAIANIDWPTMFYGLDFDKVTHSFTSKCANIFSEFIPNKTITCDNLDPPWMTPSLKSVIKRKHRVYNKYVKRGRKPDDWDMCVLFATKSLRKLLKSKMISSLTQVKTANGTKSYWTTLNQIINKKIFPIYHLYWKMECLLLPFKAKQIFLITILSSNVL